MSRLDTKQMRIEDENRRAWERFFQTLPTFEEYERRTAAGDCSLEFIWNGWQGSPYAGHEWGRG